MDIWLILLFPFHGIQRFLDYLISILIIGILAAIMLHAYLPLHTKANVLTGALSGMITYSREIHHYWALYGRWPSSHAQLDRPYDPDRLKAQALDAVIEDGAIHVRFGKGVLAQKTLTCRPAVAGQSVIWLCGEPPLSSEWIVQGRNLTNIGASLIPRDLQASNQ